MAQYFHREQSNFRQLYSSTFLGLAWAFGFAAGLIVHCTVGPVFSLWMPGIMRSPVSIVGLLCVTCFPFLFSAFAVYIGMRWLLYPVCFGKALLFSAVSAGIWVQFGSAGWLAWLLIMFSDVVSLPLLFGYCSRHISGFRLFSASEVLFTVSCLILIGSVDYGCISPFLAKLSF